MNEQTNKMNPEIDYSESAVFYLSRGTRVISPKDYYFLFNHKTRVHWTFVPFVLFNAVIIALTDKEKYFLYF